MGMSIYDILGAIGYFTASNAAPRKLSDQVYGAIGNDATCTAQAFFLYLGTGVPLYNMMLSIYYLLVIRYEVRDEILKKYEKFMHLYVFLSVVTTITISLIFDLFATSGGIYCAIVQYPENEKDVKNIGSTLIKASAGVVIFTFLIIALCMMGIYCTVKDQASTMNQYPSIRNSTTNTNLNQHANNNNNTRQYDDTKTQASLYIAAYLFTYSTITLTLINGDDSTFALSLMVSITVPLQGFWNMLNFIRPKFIAIRQKNLSKSFSWVLKASIFSSLEEEEQKKRIANRRATFRRNFSSTSNPNSSNHDVENPTSESNNNNNDNRCNNTRRSSYEVIGTQLVHEDNNSDQQQQQQQHDDDYDDCASSKSPSTRLISPLSMTALLAYDKLLDRTMFIDDTLPIIKKEEDENVSKAGQMKRRHSLPSSFLMSHGSEFNV